MIYCEDCSSYECGCPERKEIESLRQQLTDHIKREVMLRGLIAALHKGGVMGFDRDGMRLCAEALAATDDLKDVILCHAEPRAWNETITGRLATSDDHHRSRFPMCYEPLYRAWEPK